MFTTFNPELKSLKLSFVSWWSFLGDWASNNFVVVYEHNTTYLKWLLEWTLMCSWTLLLIVMCSLKVDLVYSSSFCLQNSTALSVSNIWTLLWRTMGSTIRRIHLLIFSPITTWQEQRPLLEVVESDPQKKKKKIKWHKVCIQIQGFRALFP